jgi:phage tail-like protein
MAFENLDVGAGYGFKMTIDGIEVPRLMEVSGLSSEVDVIEIKQNEKDGKFSITKVMGRRKVGEVVITRGLTQDKAITDWLAKVMEGKISDSRKNAAITITDYANAPVKEYSLTNCWVKKVEVGTLKAGGTDVLQEKFTLVYEEMKAK